MKSLLVNVITDIQRRLKPKKLSDADYKEIEDKLTVQFEVKKSVIGATVTFLNRKQHSGESIENYARVLNDLCSACKYNDCCRDRSLRDAFVSGLRSSYILSGLLQDCENKSFNDCVEKAKMLESFTADAQDIKPEMKAHSNFKITDDRSSRNNVSSSYVCIRCGARARHLAKDCFALKLKCKKCSKIGHIAKVCKSTSLKRNPKTVRQEAAATVHHTSHLSALEGGDSAVGGEGASSSTHGVPTACSCSRENSFDDNIGSFLG